MTGPTIAPYPPASAPEIQNRKQSALSLLLSTNPRRLPAMLPSRGEAGTLATSSRTTETHRNASAYLELLKDWILLDPINPRAGRRQAATALPSCYFGARIIVGWIERSETHRGHRARERRNERYRSSAANRENRLHSQGGEL